VVRRKKEGFTILGGQQFLKEEAQDYSKGFAEGSYEWIEPIDLKIRRLRLEKEKLEKESMKSITNSPQYSFQKILEQTIKKCKRNRMKNKQEYQSTGKLLLK
jgi:hypothetical protein